MFSLAFFACSEDDTAPLAPTQQQPVEEEPQENPNVPVAITFTEVGAGSYPRSPYGTPYPAGTYVISSQADWVAYATYPGPGSTTAPSNSALDFSTYTYIAFRHDFQPSSSPLIKIYAESVIQQNNQITVKYVKTGLPADQPGLAMESHPFQIIRIPATTLPINFVQVP